MSGLARKYSAASSADEDKGMDAGRRAVEHGNSMGEHVANLSTIVRSGGREGGKGRSHQARSEREGMRQGDFALLLLVAPPTWSVFSITNRTLGPQ